MSNLWDEVKPVFTEKFIDLNVFIRKLKINCPSLQLKKLKELQIKPKKDV